MKPYFKKTPPQKSDKKKINANSVFRMMKSKKIVEMILGISNGNNKDYVDVEIGEKSRLGMNKRKSPKCSLKGLQRQTTDK